MFLENVKLGLYSNYKIGGPARYFFEAESVEQIIKAVVKFRQIQSSKAKSYGRGGDKIFILAGGTNILFNDEGFEGLILKPNIRFIKREGEALRVGAGVPVNQLLDYLMAKNLSGLEWAGGLPGTIGGAIKGNAGSFGGEIKNIVEKVASLDISRPGGRIIVRNNKNCNFGYRSSIFKTNKQNEIILEAVLVFKKENRRLMQETIKRNIEYRRQRQPLEHPSIGSIFKNIPLTQVNEDYKQIATKEIRINRYKKPGQSQTAFFPIKNDPFPLIPIAHLISETGLKGISCGGAMISPKHPNFIVNVLNATASDVKNLIELTKNKIQKKFNIVLEEEIIRP